MFSVRCVLPSVIVRAAWLNELYGIDSATDTITSLLPLHESFGFSDEIRKRTSGGASAQLVFHGFEMLDQDPFWVPATEEEKEDLGDTADRENRAKAIVDKIRDRKGLLVQSRQASGKCQDSGAYPGYPIYYPICDAPMGRVV